MKTTLALLAFALLLLPVAAVTFSDVSAAPSTTKANITWGTDVNCSSVLYYGTSDSYGKTASKSMKTTAHNVSISGLAQNTTYHYRMKCAVNSTYSENSTDYTFSTPASFPDLTITKVTVTPNSTTLDKNVSVKAYFKNNGDAKAQNFLVKFTCADGVTQSKAVSSLSAGGSSSVSVTCPPPPSAGTYQIVADIDPPNSLPESNEENNVMQAAATYGTVPKPDLAITDSDITSEFKETSGTMKITLKIYVTNDGTAKATSVKVKVEAGTTTTTKTISSIPAGGRGVATVTLPAQGNTHFTVTVDPENRISELNEGNNVATHAASAESVLPDLLVTESGITHSPSAPKTGGNLVITAKIYNNGSATANGVKVRFVKVEDASAYKDKGDGEVKEEEFAPGSGFEFLDQLKKKPNEMEVRGEVIGEVTISSIAPGANKPAKVTYVIPQATGSIIVVAIVNPENMIQESSYGNNIAGHEISVALLYPELMVNESSITFAPTTATTFSTVKVSANIRNGGALNAQNVPVEFYVSADGGPFSKIGNATLRKLNSKSSSKVSVDWAVPSGVQMAEFMVRVDPLGTIVELNKANNEAHKNLTIALPDLELSGDDISVAGSVAVGSQVTIKANVSNIGTAKMQGAIAAFYYQGAGGGLVLIGEKTLTVNAGGKTAVTATWTVPSGISANPAIVVKANGDGAIYEPDLGNNVGTLALNAKLPDFSTLITTSPRHPIIPGATGRFKDIFVTVTVHNGGTDKAQNVLVKVRVNGADWEQWTIPLISAGGYGSKQFLYKLNSSSQPGDYIFEAIANANGAVTEATTDNNGATATAHAYANLPPQAVINQTKTTAVKRESVTFSCLPSIDPDYPGFSWYGCAWKFDGVSKDSEGYDYTGQDTDYQFTTSGTHNIELTVTDIDGGTDTATSTLYIQPNRAPNVELEDTIMYTNVEGTIPVYASDPDGNIVSMVWNFGDGQTATTGPEGASHTYASTGTRTISVIVTDDSGAVASDTATVSIVNAPPMQTTTGSEVFIGHLHVYRPGGEEHCPCAAVWYAFYRVDYEIKYSGHTIHQIKYTLRAGPALVDAVSDADEYSMFQDITAGSSEGGTALQVYGIEIRDANQHTVWEDSGGPHLSPSESPVTTTLTGLDIPVEVWDGTKYLVVKSVIAYPGQMCADDGNSCQDHWALVPFN